jgi:uncharacterized protein (TIGR02147 family)
MKSIFEFDLYREFLRARFPGTGELRGLRKRLAEALGCQPSFVSLVITERAHMSEDMILETAEFLKLREVETEYLLQIYHSERAGTAKLRKYYERKIESIRLKKSQVDQALAKKTDLSFEDKTKYYSSWLNAAVHIAATLNTGETVESIARRLEYAEDEVRKAADFLISIGLIEEKASRLRTTNNRVHLSRNSPLAPVSHSSWRVESIRHIQKMREENMHFSSVYSISKSDYWRIKKMLEEAILACEKVVRESKHEQDLCAISIDLYKY